MISTFTHVLHHRYREVTPINKIEHVGGSLIGDKRCQEVTREIFMVSRNILDIISTMLLLEKYVFNLPLKSIFDESKAHFHQLP